MTRWAAAADLAGRLCATYAYDTENHLLSVTATGHSDSYAYDPLGRRTQKTVDGVVTAFLSEGSREIADYDGRGTLLRRHVVQEQAKREG
jgi:YD repeat-containing protein